MNRREKRAWRFRRKPLAMYHSAASAKRYFRRQLKGWPMKMTRLAAFVLSLALIATAHAENFAPGTTSIREIKGVYLIIVVPEGGGSVSITAADSFGKLEGGSVTPDPDPEPDPTDLSQFRAAVQAAPAPNVQAERKRVADLYSGVAKLPHADAEGVRGVTNTLWDAAVQSLAGDWPPWKAAVDQAAAGLRAADDAKKAWQIVAESLK